MEYKRITLRIPASTYQDVLDVAEKKGISVTAEIINRVQTAYNKANVIDESEIKRIAREVIREELNK